MSTVLDRTKPKQSGQGIPLPEPTRRAIVGAYSVNGSIAMTAREFGVHRNTVATLVKSVRHIQNSPVNKEWKSAQRERAVRAVNAALDCEDDPYRRGDIGVKALTGLGEYRRENEGDANVNVFVTQINALPEHLRTMFHCDSSVIDTVAIEQPSTLEPSTLSTSNE